MMGLSLGMGLMLGSGGSGGTPTPSSPLSSIATTGWQAEYAATPPSLNPLVPITVSRQGYDATGATTTYSETLTVTQRVRQAYPNQASLSALTVALSDYALTTDTISGVTNNSAEVMPKPIANWVMQSRQIVGNTLRLGVTGNHWAARNGKPFACVVFTVTDGTNTVTKTVTSMTVSTTGANDRCAVLAYEDDVDITSLTDGALITANAVVYPWVGGAASVNDSSTGSGVREFSPRVFKKDTAKFAAPNVVIVSSTGVDATAYVGTDPTLAALSPALTPTGAVNRARTVLGTAAGSLDGLRVQLTDGTWSFSASPTANTVNVNMVIEPAPGATPANVIFEFGGVSATSGATYLRVRGGLTLRRAGALYLYNVTTGFCVIEGVTFNPNGNTGAMSSANPAWFFYNGVTFTTNASSILNAGANAQAMLRGVSISNSFGSWEGHVTVGCSISNVGGYAVGSRLFDGLIIQFNKFLGVSASVAVVNVTGTGTISQVSVSQNLFEVTHTTTSTPCLRASSDASAVNLTHVLLDSNTVACSHYQAGRLNMFYDETDLVYRTHKFCRASRTIVPDFYIKEDVFMGVNGNGSPNPTDAPFHVGNWSALYGVKVVGLHSLLVNVGSTQIGQDQGLAYPGLLSSIGSSQTVPQYSLTAGVTFTNWQATTTNTGTGAAVAGAGGGDYTLPPGSALIGILTASDEVFPRDLDGNLRDRGSIGCYR